MYERQQQHSDPSANAHVYAPGAQKDPRAGLHGGVERFMAGVFAWMGAGLAVTAAVSFGLSTQEALLYAIFSTPLMWGLFAAPLVFAFFVAPQMHRMAPSSAKIAFFVYATLIGAWLSPLPMVFQVPEIFGTFVATAATFGVMALFGFVTKRDLTGLGRFLMMAAFGLLIAWLVSIFIPGVYFWVAALGVVIFAGLTAYDLAIIGALTLYVDFVNIFLFLLHLFGGGGSRD